jgi:hypothetical protein
MIIRSRRPAGAAGSQGPRHANGKGWSVQALGMAAVLASLVAVAGCSHNGGGQAAPGTSASVPSESSTPTAQSDGLGGGEGESSPPRSSIVTTPEPTLSTKDGVEIDKPCPYATADEFRGAEGDRVGRVVQLMANPVGCRFYFEYDPSAIVGEIRIEKFATSTEAFNAVVVATKGHPEFVDDKNIGDGGSVSIRLPLQGEQTWACIFSKGTYVVTAQSRQTTVGQDARNIAKLIEPRIP